MGWVDATDRVACSPWAKGAADVPSGVAQPQGPEASFILGMAQTGHSCPAWKEKNVIFIEDNCIEQQLTKKAFTCFFHILKSRVSTYLYESQVRLCACTINLPKHHRGGKRCLGCQDCALPPAVCDQWEQGLREATAPEHTCACLLCSSLPGQPGALPDILRSVLWPVFYHRCLQVLAGGAEKMSSHGHSFSWNVLVFCREFSASLHFW